MSLRLAATVISLTGKAITPFRSNSRGAAAVVAGDAVDAWPISSVT